MPNRLSVLAQQLLVNLRPHNTESSRKLGVALIKAQRYLEAETIAQKLCQLEPQNPWNYELLGKVLNHLKHYPEAILALEQAIALDPTISWSKYELGLAWSQTNQPSRAIEPLQESINLNPDFIWTYYLLSEVLLDQAQWTQAIPVCEKGLAVDPHFDALRLKLEYAQHLNAKKPMDVETLLKHPPKLHQNQGRLISLGVSADLARFLEQHTHADSYTLETGGGISTIVLAIQHTHHHCVIPDPELASRIKDYCHRCQVLTDRITFHLDRSEKVLPNLTPQPLDLVLIDGRHAFPSPFIDWYYTTEYLKQDGITIVDDTQLWTGDVLKQFLKQEAEWKMVAEFPPQAPTSVAFQQIKLGSNEKWWAQQPYAINQAPVPPTIVA